MKVEPKNLDIIMPQTLEVSWDFAAILQKMTRFDFQQRYQSAREILERL
ncbi:MAG: hypothetical protein QNJ70_06945 [Xenococcaceae cyanobacterium MO_207.B15]|nr:hypothetical protein [Xenococcaceae cyanobacterium MO_207.B15]